jgi:hypothetical protein
MNIHFPPSLTIDDRLIGIGFAVLGVILFVAIFGRRIWSKIKRVAGRPANTWVQAILFTCTPIILALILGIIAALIWPHLGILKDSFQAQIGSIPIQVDGSAGVFTIVYLGGLTFLGNRLPQEPQAPPPAVQPARFIPDSNWPDRMPDDDSS